MKVVELKTAKEGNQEQVIATLASMLDLAKTGKLTEFVSLSVEDDAFTFRRSAGVSLLNGVAYASMLHDWMLRQLRPQQ